MPGAFAFGAVIQEEIKLTGKAHGGKRHGAGRKPGSRSRATVEQKATLSELAQSHTEDALGALVDVMRTGSDSARVAAANALLDRGYGKPVQATDVTSKGEAVAFPSNILVTAPDDSRED